MSKLIKFYGEGCHFCEMMQPLDERLEKDLGVKLERLEVWDNQDNAEKLSKVDTSCGGVPFYLNSETSQSLCGAVDYATLTAWAQGKKPAQPVHNHNEDQHNQDHLQHG